MFKLSALPVTLANSGLAEAESLQSGSAAGERSGSVLSAAVALDFLSSLSLTSHELSAHEVNPRNPIPEPTCPCAAIPLRYGICDELWERVSAVLIGVVGMIGWGALAAVVGLTACNGLTAPPSTYHASSQKDKRSFV